MLIRYGFKGKLTPRITQQKHFQLHKFPIPKLIKKYENNLLSLHKPIFYTNHGEYCCAGLYSFRVDDACIAKSEGDIWDYNLMASSTEKEKEFITDKEA